MENKVIVLNKVSKEYVTGVEKCLAIKDISLNVKEEEVVSIMGASGCGKSTLLNIVGGIIPPTSGQIIFDGNVYEAGVPRDALKKVGYVFQSDNLLQWRTVGKNLNFPLEIMNLKGEMWESRKDELLDMVGLLAYKEAFPFELSGGMKQRIGIIRALMHDPNILLMDQPFGALDAITRKMLSFDFLDLWKKTRKTILMVTNDLDEALLLSTRILIMKNDPGEIFAEIEVDIPIEDRDEHVVKNQRHVELRKKLRKMFAELDATDGRSKSVVKENA